MLKSWREPLECLAVSGFRRWRMPFVLASVFTCMPAAGSEALRVENPADIAFSIAAMTHRAKEMGLTDAGFAATLKSSLSRAGLSGRLSDLEHDSDVLFVDVIVEDETYYASLGFWRMASYRLPGGELNSGFVTVWQDYAVGAHHDDPATVSATVRRIIERFIVTYSDANSVRRPLRIASTR